MNIFITGGAGFIGSSLADSLLQKGHSVIVIDNLSPYYNPEIKKQNISQALKNPNYKFYLGDIEAPNDLQKYLNKIKLIALFIWQPERASGRLLNPRWLMRKPILSEQ